MSLALGLRDRLRPFHGLVALVFLLGTGASLWRRTGDPTAVGPFVVLLAVTEGLLALVLFRFTVGTVWAYVVEYLNAGGSAGDPKVMIELWGHPVVVTSNWVAVYATDAL